ncbi:CDP-alcohol phosphatidyltransferase family protein [Archaeoglobales archaeon]|nr:MAG: CDP-alcohol phosphatidyltransferase family protein [Archaeoglobales archaeon]
MLSKFKDNVTELLIPLTNKIVEIGIKPNHLTFIGLIVGFISAYFIATGKLIIGAVVLLLSGFFDMLDGILARNQELTTRFGGFLDSVFDRYVDVAIFIALGIYGIDWFYVALALSGALLVSYTRARAEKIIDKCDVGIAERGERIIILFFGLISNYVLYAVIIIAILSHLTATHRIIFTFTKSRS